MTNLASEITLDQLRGLVALATHTTYAAASKSLHKSPSALVYSIKTLEEHLDLTLFDRDGYRSKLNAQGEHVLRYAQRVLESEAALLRYAQELRSGWEAQLRVVYDGVLYSEPWMRAFARFHEVGAPTELIVSTAYLADVEREFEEHRADFMISVFRIDAPQLAARALEPLHAYLVASASHPLAQSTCALSMADLQEHALVTVRGSDARLNLSTQSLEESATFRVDDFLSKKTAILSGAGYGWLPEYLARKEIDQGTLKILNTEIANQHTFEPHLYYKHNRPLGRAAKLFLEFLFGDSKTA